MAKNVGTVAVALSGGAAKGLAHIGVLKALEEHGLEPDYIAGTSAGALVGGLYCAGVSVKELERITTSIDKTDFRKLIDVTWARGSMVAGRKVEEFLRGIVGNVHIEDLGKPFIATAVDISSGIGYHFTKGPLVDAIRASISIPGVFEPVEANGGFLVDGGVRQNLPLRVLVQYNPDILIGADVLATDQLGFEWNEGAVERTSSDLPVERDLWERIKDRFEGETPEETQFPGMTFLMSQVFEIITREGSHKEIEETKPDLVVQLDTDEVQLWEFWRGRDAIGLGFKQSMPVIAEFLAGRSRLSGFKTRWKRLLRRNL